MCCMLCDIAFRGGDMSRGLSGRIVIEVVPELKRRLYSALATQDLTLKDWFIRCAENHISDVTQPRLPGLDEQPKGEL